MSWSHGSKPGGSQNALSGAARGGLLTPARGAIVSLTSSDGSALPYSLAVPPAHRGGLEEMREQARACYLRGAVAEAMDLQQQALAAAKVTNELKPDDFLFLGLMLYGAKRIAEGVHILKDGAAAYPRNASMHENLGVFLLAEGDAGQSLAECEIALGLGSDSPNIHDCMCDAFNRIGRPDQAVLAGRSALEAKDRMFGARPPLVAMPTGHPPAFNPTAPRQNIIAYCLWGNEMRYKVPLLESARILPHLFPSWTIRLYHDGSVERGYLEQLAACNVELRHLELPYGVPAHRKLLWRFDVVSDPSVQRFLIRDADSLLNVKERVAVDAWLQSSYFFHTMRDWYTHTDLLLAGMWGGVGNILPSTAGIMQGYSGWRMENDHIDQDVLSEAVWPTIRGSVLIHDSIFSPCLGSVPFPPFGHLPPDSHIGQNAFLHFTPKV